MSDSFYSGQFICSNECSVRQRLGFTHVQRTDLVWARKVDHEKTFLTSWNIS